MRWWAWLGLFLALIAAGALALFVYGVGANCQSDGGGTNCDTIVVISYVIAGGSVALIALVVALLHAGRD